MGIRRLFLAVSGLLLLAAGCAPPEVPDALVVEPMRRPVIALATEIRHNETGGSGSFIQSSPPMSTTTYEVLPEDLEAAAADVLAQAAAADWNMEPASATVPGTDLAHVWSDTKLVDQGGLRLIIGFSDTKIVPGGRDPDFGTITVELLGG